MLEQSSRPVAEEVQANGQALTANPTEAETTFHGKTLGVSFWLAAAWLIVLLLAAILANVLPLKNPNSTFPGTSRHGPTAAHWFGSDNIGKDIFSRCIFGARKSLTVGFVSYIFAFLFGTSLGLIAGFYRGRIEGVIIGALDVLLAFPPLVLLIAIVSFLGPDTKNLVISLVILATPNVARIIRAQVLQYREREFVLAARTIGASNMRIMVREILPNAAATAGGFVLVGIANLIVAEGALAFVGASNPNKPSWGVMINQGRSVLDTAPHIVIFPALMIVFTVFSMNFMGDRLRERLEVKESNA